MLYSLEKEADAKGVLPCLMSHSEGVADLGLELESKSHVLFTVMAPRVSEDLSSRSGLE